MSTSRLVDFVRIIIYHRVCRYEREREERESEGKKERLGERKTGRGGRGRGKWPAGYKVSNVDGIVLLELAINSANDDKKRRAQERSKRFRRIWKTRARERM